MIVHMLDDIEKWLEAKRREKAYASNFTDEHAMQLGHKHVFDFVARYILDNKPQGLERGMDWSEYLNAIDLDILADYTKGKTNTEKSWLNLPAFMLSFNGRKKGALGVGDWFYMTVLASDVQAARLKLYDTHEHISRVTLHHQGRESWEAIKGKAGLYKTARMVCSGEVVELLAVTEHGKFTVKDKYGAQNVLPHGWLYDFTL